MASYLVPTVNARIEPIRVRFPLRSSADQEQSIRSPLAILRMMSMSQVGVDQRPSKSLIGGDIAMMGIPGQGRTLD